MAGSTENTGYSKTPLAKKLGIKAGFKATFIGQPESYFDLFEHLPEDLEIVNDSRIKKNFIHYFTYSSEQLHQEISGLKNQIEQDGIIWISWPKKASKVPTDLTGNIVRSIGLKSGLVDIKICAVNEIWSGLKFVIPVKDRTNNKS